MTLPLFDDLPEPDPPKYEPPGEVREPIKERAGTRIDHKNASRIYGTAKKEGGSHHGLLDFSQRVYQCGGEMSKFIYWKEHWVTLPLDVWQKIDTRAEWLEVIDHEKNQCWRIAIELASKFGRKYNAGLGDRWGIPTELFDIIDAEGTIVRPRKERPNE